MATIKVKLNTRRGRATRSGGRATRPPNRGFGGGGFGYLTPAPRPPTRTETILAIIGWIGAAAALCALIYVTLQINRQSRQQQAVLGEQKADSMKQDAQTRENLKQRRESLESLVRQESLRETEKRAALTEVSKETSTLKRSFETANRRYAKEIEFLRRTIDNSAMEAAAAGEAPAATKDELPPLTLAGLRSQLTDLEAEHTRLDEEWRNLEPAQTAAAEAEPVGVDPAIIRVKLQESQPLARPANDPREAKSYIACQIVVNNLDEAKVVDGLRVLVFFYGKSDQMENQYVLFERSSSPFTIGPKQSAKSVKPIEVPIGYDRNRQSYLGATYEGYIILVSDATRHVIMKRFKTPTFENAELANLLTMQPGDRFDNQLNLLK